MICSLSYCDKPRHSRELCAGHYAQAHRGKPLRPLRGQPGNPYKGKRATYRRGRTATGRRAYEHRIVMERALGRPLAADEQVHHLNGDRLDNRLENLELWSASQPPGQRIEDKVEWAIGILALYRPEALAREQALT